MTDIVSAKHVSKEDAEACMRLNNTTDHPLLAMVHNDDEDEWWTMTLDEAVGGMWPFTVYIPEFDRVVSYDLD